MEKVRRVLVSVCRDGVAPQNVPFLQSVTGHFGAADQVKVRCWLERNRLMVLKDDTDRGVPLKRAASCPIKYLSAEDAAAIPLDIQQRGVDVGVAVILQTANERVLLTRRATQLRIFPNVWVPPGGHVEPDETLLEAGLRELKEETGLYLEAEQLPSPKILGVWEAERRTPPQTPSCHLPAAALVTHTPAASACLSFKKSNGIGYATRTVCAPSPPRLALVFGPTSGWSALLCRRQTDTTARSTRTTFPPPSGCRRCALREDCGTPRYR
ncbi:nucleoside diphosphate-linked moiety X motif 17 isoform X2 [Nerophis ophidion]|uniref:nucleoside diphosphate-linked moiety X motif 17 isoform X2 n=1 Tax=Nerophis ophidion TaxID=159077 RepID=UPI002ADFCCAF|nr:nucleoside diphosphate-linked moiety X motif 17 isoform X2 [Nerophis ophidion]